MAGDRKQSGSLTAAELLRASSKAEKVLLRAERDAEKRLRKARGRLEDAQNSLDKARERFERRIRQVERSTIALAQCQEARAIGPREPGSDGNEETSLPDDPIKSDASPKPEAAP